VFPSRDGNAVQHCLRGAAVKESYVASRKAQTEGATGVLARRLLSPSSSFDCCLTPVCGRERPLTVYEIHRLRSRGGELVLASQNANASAFLVSSSSMKLILIEIVNRLSDMGSTLGALQAALVHTRQLTTSDVERLIDAHRRDVESHLTALRASIACLPD
jgi:hypothetical protein